MGDIKSSLDQNKICVRNWPSLLLFGGSVQFSLTGDIEKGYCRTCNWVARPRQTASPTPRTTPIQDRPNWTLPNCQLATGKWQLARAVQREASLGDMQAAPEMIITSRQPTRGRRSLLFCPLQTGQKSPCDCPRLVGNTISWSNEIMEGYFKRTSRAIYIYILKLS